MFSFVQNISFLPYLFLLITYLAGITAVSVNLANSEISVNDNSNISFTSIRLADSSQSIFVSEDSVLPISQSLFDLVKNNIYYSPPVFKLMNVIFREFVVLSNIFRELTSRPPPYLFVLY